MPPTTPDDPPKRSEANRKFPAVGIGASAGDVEALQSLFRAMPDPAPLTAFVIVTHLGAHHKRALPEILSECTTMPIHAAQHGEVVVPGHAYVLPHDAILTIVEGRLVLRTQSPGAPRERQPIDVFLTSLAGDLQEWAVGIVPLPAVVEVQAGLQGIGNRCHGLLPATVSGGFKCGAPPGATMPVLVMR